jgi:4-amino-4-deoxy-L-arabinose transferase-like glycosyltransferase
MIDKRDVSQLRLFNLVSAVFAVALMVRVGAALWLEHRTRAAGKQHEFADSDLYWLLAQRIADGQPYHDGKRAVLRTPGYPAFLAASVRLFGPSTVAARHLQAAVGAAACVMVFFLVRRLIDARTAVLAAALAAVYPFAVFLSAVLLSETLFGALLVAQLIVLSLVTERAVQGERPRGILMLSMVAGFIGAAGTLVRPSWLLATPFSAIALLLVRRRRAAAVAGVMLAAFALGMAPWCLRNWRVTGHLVPTTLWVGASLYDGLNPRADGSSRMDFMDRPADFGLDPTLVQMNEWEQDCYLREQAIAYARSHPGRVLQLAAIKFARFWNPLPNAAEWQSAAARIASLASYGPVLVLAVIGVWRLRRRPTTLALLAGPVLYFAAIHLVFVSSVRYREAAMLPVLGLAAAAIVRAKDHS